MHYLTAKKVTRKERWKEWFWSPQQYSRLLGTCDSIAETEEKSVSGDVLGQCVQCMAIRCTYWGLKGK